jgi:hypothetical protein
MVQIFENEEGFYQELTLELEKLNNEELDIQEWFTTSLKPLMLSGNHNFLTTCLVIKRLIDTRDKNSSLFRLTRVLEMIYEWANGSPNADVQFLAETARFSHSGDSIPVELINSVMNIVRRPGNIAGGDILKLHRLYSGPTPPSVSFLRSKDVIHHLIFQTFSPKHTTSYQKEKLWLIAYSAFWNSTPSCKQDIATGNELLNDLDRLLERVTSMNQIQDHIIVFMDLVQEPICAAAIIIWLKAKFFDDAFYEWVQFSQGEIPMAFHILDEVR